jgi:hypothetical protein
MQEQVAEGSNRKVGCCSCAATKVWQAQHKDTMQHKECWRSAASAVGVAAGLRQQLLSSRHRGGGAEAGESAPDCLQPTLPCRRHATLVSLYPASTA